MCSYVLVPPFSTILPSPGGRGHQLDRVLQLRGRRQLVSCETAKLPRVSGLVGWVLVDLVVVTA